MRSMKRILVAALLIIASAGECAWAQKSIPKPKINKSSTTTTSTSSKKASTISRATGTIAGHDYVDLGLSVKWATCNVGASSPSAYGNYYAWGETSTKSLYGKDNCETLGKEIGNIGGTSRDVARVKWGSPWRLPTKAEFDELLDSENCTWTWTTQGYHNGYKVTSRKNGNSIFLPAAGWRYGTSLRIAGQEGLYWSCTPNGSMSAYGLYFYSSDRSTFWDDRNGGRTVRPVAEF